MTSRFSFSLEFRLSCTLFEKVFSAIYVETRTLELSSLIIADTQKNFFASEIINDFFE